MQSDRLVWRTPHVASCMLHMGGAGPPPARCAARDLGGFWTVVDLAQGGVALVHVACWRRTIHVGGARDARLQDYQVSFVRCHRFVTVTAAQKISFISNPRAGRPVFHLFIQFSIYFICSILMTNVNLNDVLFVDCLPRYIKSLCSRCAVQLKTKPSSKE